MTSIMTAEQYQRAAERSEFNYRLSVVEDDLSEIKTELRAILERLVELDAFLSSDADGDDAASRANVLALQSTSARAIVNGAGTSALLLADRYDLN